MKNMIQYERMKKYFLEAAKEIIKSEGIEAASTRTIAERAGYSYATMYNYFADIGELLSSVSLLFVEECRAYILQRVNQKSQKDEYLSAVSSAYVEYFVQYPAIFSLLFCENICVSSNGDSHLEQMYECIDALVQDRIDCSSNAFRKYKYALHGLLLFYLNRKNVMDYTKMRKELELLRLS